MPNFTAEPPEGTDLHSEIDPRSLKRIRLFQRFFWGSIILGVGAMGWMVFTHLEMVNRAAESPGFSLFGGSSPKSEFGDYAGGSLGPFFSFMSLIILLQALVLQAWELAYTRNELKKAGQAAQSLANAQQAEVAQTKLANQMRAEEIELRGEELKVRNGDLDLRKRSIALRKQLDIRESERDRQALLKDVPIIEAEEEKGSFYFADNEPKYSFVGPIPFLPAGMKWNPGRNPARRELRIEDGSSGMFWLLACSVYGEWVVAPVVVGKLTNYKPEIRRFHRIIDIQKPDIRILDGVDRDKVGFPDKECKQLIDLIRNYNFNQATHGDLLDLINSKPTKGSLLLQ
jgi:hypothetical protein